MSIVQSTLFDLPTPTIEEALYRECRSMLGRPATLAELQKIGWPSQWVKRKPKNLSRRARDMAQAIIALRLPPDPDCDDTELSGLEATIELRRLIRRYLGRDPTHDELIAADPDIGGMIAVLNIGCPRGQAMPHPQRTDALREQAWRIAQACKQVEAQPCPNGEAAFEHAAPLPILAPVAKRTELGEVW